MNTSDIDFDIFDYRLPPHGANVYANQALDILKLVHNEQLQTLPNLLAANTALTLSGVRAYDTYITFEDIEQTEIEKTIRLLDDNGISLFSAKTEYDTEDVDTHHLLHRQALAELPNNYTMPFWTAPIAPFNADRFAAWCGIVQTYITERIQSNDNYPSEWLKDPWLAHNIRFGALLGYPGEAIVSLCWEEVMYLNGIEPPTVSAKIVHADAYDAAQPIYSFMETLESNPTIVSHQRLWSEILTFVYGSDWHKAYKSQNHACS